MIGKLLVTNPCVVLAVLLACSVEIFLILVLALWTCVSVCPDPPLVPAQLSGCKAVRVHLCSLSSSGIVKELMSSPSPAWWPFSICREMQSRIAVEMSGSWKCRGVGKGMPFSGPQSCLMMFQVDGGDEGVSMPFSAFTLYLKLPQIPTGLIQIGWEQSSKR